MSVSANGVVVCEQAGVLCPLDVETLNEYGRANMVTSETQSKVEAASVVKS